MGRPAIEYTYVIRQISVWNSRCRWFSRFAWVDDSSRL